MRTTVGCLSGTRLILCSADTFEGVRAELGSASPNGEVPVGPARVALIARDDAEEAALVERVTTAEDPSRLQDERILHVSRPLDGDVVFMFPGQGAQRSGMLAELRAELPSLDDRLAELAGSVRACRSVLEMIGREHDDEREALLTATQYAQPALALVCSALAAELASLGIEPDLSIGHSVGELVALSAMGAYDTMTLLRLAVERGRCMAEADERREGRMLAALAGASETMALMAAAGVEVELAAVNGPAQTVLSGKEADIEAAAAALTAGHVRFSLLHTSSAFHSALMAPARETFEWVLARTDIAPFAGTVASNVTGSWYSGDPAEARDLLARQLTMPVRWIDDVRATYERGGRVFVEVGPGRTLTRLLDQCLPEDHDEVLAVALDPGDRDTAVGWLRSLAILGLHGAPLRESWQRSAEPVVVAASHERRPHPVPPAATAATELPVVSMYLQEAARQVEEYFRQQERLVAAGADAATVRTALELNSSVVRSFLEWGARVVGGDAGPAQSNGAIHAAAATRADGPVTALLAELTGHPAEEISGELRLEEDLGLTSISLAELLARLAEEHDGPAPDQDRLRGLRTVDDLIRLAGSASADDSALAEVRAAIASLTGYPESTIASHLRLEDDLGLTSISLVEILAEYGLTGDEEALVSTVTVGDLAEAIRSRGSAAPARASLPAPRSVETSAAPLRPPAPEPVLRFGFSRVGVEIEAGPLPPRIAVVTPAAALSTGLADAARAAGAEADAWVVEPGTFIADGERHEFGSASIGDRLERFFDDHDPAVLFAAGAGEASSSLDVTGLAFSAFARTISSRWPRGARCRIAALAPEAGAPGATTVVGYARALQKEWPDATVRAALCEGEIVADGTAELVTLMSGPSETRLVRDADGHFYREVHVAVPPEAGGVAAGGARTSFAGALLATGGGDGITAEAIVALARRLGCPVVAIGRTDPDEPGAGARREALLRTRARVEEAGSEFVYLRADATDADGVAEAVDEVRARFGGIGGVILGAGIMHEGRIEQKEPKLEAEVLDSKLRQVQVFREVLCDDAPDFVVAFSSIASYTGNVAQAEYVAANVGLEAAAAEWDRAVAYPVRSILWSIWHETGLAPAWVRRQISDGGGLQGISNAVGAELLAEELERIESSPQRVLFAPESVVRYLLPVES